MVVIRQLMVDNAYDNGGNTSVDGYYLIFVLGLTLTSLNLSKSFLREMSIFTLFNNFWKQNKNNFMDFLND